MVGGRIDVALWASHVHAHQAQYLQSKITWILMTEAMPQHIASRVLTARMEAMVGPPWMPSQSRAGTRARATRSLYAKPARFGRSNICGGAWPLAALAARAPLLYIAPQRPVPGDPTNGAGQPQAQCGLLCATNTMI